MNCAACGSPLWSLHVCPRAAISGRLPVMVERGMFLPDQLGAMREDEKEWRRRIEAHDDPIEARV